MSKLALPALVLSLAVAACGGEMRAAEPGMAPAQPTSVATSEAALPPQEQQATRAPRVVSLEPLTGSAPSADAHVEILFPFAEQKIRVDRARAFVVRLKVERWRAELVDLSLDEFVPRRRDTLPTPLRLGDLVPADREFSAGEHLLVATAVEADGRLLRGSEQRSRAPFAAVRFWVGERGRPALELEKPFIVYRQPRGTYNGPSAADHVLVDFLVLGGSLGDALGARVAIKGQGVVGDTLLREPRASLVRDLPSGDFVVELALVGPDDKPLGQPAARAARTITVNRDAPSPEKQP